MAFTGTPVVTKVTDRCFRITGVSLMVLATGTLGFSDKTVAAEISIEAPNWDAYKLPGATISLQDMVQITMNVVTDVTAAVPISVAKTGTTHADFVATFSNPLETDDSAELEIYVTLAGH